MESQFTEPEAGSVDFSGIFYVNGVETNQTEVFELDFYRTGYRSVKAHQYDKDTRFIEVTCIKDASAYPLNPNTKTCILKLQTPEHMLKTQTIQPDGKILIALEESMLLAAGTY